MDWRNALAASAIIAVSLVVMIGAGFVSWKNWNEQKQLERQSRPTLAHKLGWQ